MFPGVLSTTSSSSATTALASLAVERAKRMLIQIVAGVEPPPRVSTRPWLAVAFPRVLRSRPSLPPPFSLLAARTLIWTSQLYRSILEEPHNYACSITELHRSQRLPFGRTLPMQPAKRLLMERPSRLGRGMYRSHWTEDS